MLALRGYTSNRFIPAWVLTLRAEGHLCGGRAGDLHLELIIKLLAHEVSADEFSLGNAA